jgi:Flp pilus assembly protein TadD
LLFRRELLATGVRYDEALDIHDDWDFVLQLSERTRFVFADQTTFRWHSDVGTSGGGGVGNFDGEKYASQRAYVRDKWAAVFAAHVDRYNANVEQGMAAMRSGALEDASRLLDAAFTDVENDPDLLNALATVAYQRGDYPRACDLIARALRERDADPRLWLNGGLAFAAAGRVASARAAFERVLALQPGHAGAMQSLARLPA